MITLIMDQMNLGCQSLFFLGIMQDI